MDILESRNKQYGFYGTTVGNGVKAVEKEWAAAFRWVARAMPHWSPENIRDFLDSRIGRHLADEALDRRGVAKVDPAQWRAWMNEYAAEAGIVAPCLPDGTEQRGKLKRIAAAIEKAEAELRTVMQAVAAAQDGPTDAFLVLNSSVRHLNWIADALKKI